MKGETGGSWHQERRDQPRRGCLPRIGDIAKRPSTWIRSVSGDVFSKKKQPISETTPKPGTSYDIPMSRNPERSLKSIKEERKRFGEILTDALDSAGYTQPSDRDKTVVLDVGCGVCLETPVLTEKFGGSKENPRQVDIVGIDPLESRIEIARENATSSPGNHTFIVGDARNLDAYPEIPQQVDIALIRRQNIYNNPTLWEKIFTQTMGRIRPGGIAIVTSISDYEHEGMLNAFQNLGYEPDSAVASKTRHLSTSYKESLEYKIMPIDARIAVFRKPE